MKNFIKKTIVVSLLSIFIVGLGFVGQVNAQIGATFGGRKIITIPCTCSGNALIYVNDFRTHLILPLLYQPGLSKLFLWYNVFGTHLLGTYTVPLSQCLIYSGTGCIVIPAFGMLGGPLTGSGPGTGTSGL